MSMTSNRPYLIRAFFEWIVDNECTPYVVVDAYYPEVAVPEGFVNDGQIVLNLAPRAITGLEMDNLGVSFNTRFGGVPTNIYLPIGAVMGIYAKENGQGMVFQDEHDAMPSPKSKPSRPTPVEVPPTGLSAGKNEDGGDPDKPKPPSGGSGKRPSLKIIK